MVNIRAVYSPLILWDVRLSTSIDGRAANLGLGSPLGTPLGGQGRLKAVPKADPGQDCPPHNCESIPAGTAFSRHSDERSRRANPDMRIISFWIRCRHRPDILPTIYRVPPPCSSIRGWSISIVIFCPASTMAPKPSRTPSPCCVWRPIPAPPTSSPPRTPTPSSPSNPA